MHINQSFVSGGVVNQDKAGMWFFIINLNFSSFQKIHQLFISGDFKPLAAKKPVNVEEAKRLASDVARKIVMEAQQKKVAAAIQIGSGPMAQTINKDNLPTSRPPKPGTNKAAQKSKMSNLEAFKLELQQ